MTTNYAEKYAGAALDAFSKASVTEALFSAKYDWSGAKTVKVFSNATMSLNDYTRTGTARYGTMENLGNTVDTLEVDQERSFTGTIDGLDTEDTGGTFNAGAVLAQQLKVVVAPDVDAYRLDALFDACPSGQISATGAITSANAYTAFLAGNGALDEAYVPKDGRVCIAIPSYLNMLKLDANYVKASDLGQDQIVFKGQVGTIDGVPVVMVPAATMGNHVEFIIVHTDAVAAPMKLADYRTTVNPPGIHGTLIEGLYVHDCFLLDKLSAGIYIKVHA